MPPQQVAPQAQPPKPPRSSGQEEHPAVLPWTLIAGFSLIALIVGIGAGYFFEHRIASMTVANRDRVIDSLRQDIASVEAEKMTEIARLQEQLLMTAEAVPPPESPTLDAFGPTVLPKMGDRFCRGEPLTVVWNVNEIVDEVRVTINAPFPAAPIIDAPATWNELGMKGRGDVTWTVGEVKMGTSKTDLPDGELYRITMEALSGGKKIGSVESGTFSVETCQG